MGGSRTKGITDKALEREEGSSMRSKNINRSGLSQADCEWSRRMTEKRMQKPEDLEAETERTSPEAQRAVARDLLLPPSNSSISLPQATSGHTASDILSGKV